MNITKEELKERIIMYRRGLAEEVRILGIIEDLLDEKNTPKPFTNAGIEAKKIREVAFNVLGQEDRLEEVIKSRSLKKAPLSIEKKSQRLHLTLQPSLYERANNTANELGVSLNEFMSCLIDAYAD